MGFIAAHDFDVWCLDLRGYGRSTRPPAMSGPPDEAPPQVRSKAGMADLAAAVAFIRDRRGIAKLDLMGWSGGTLLTAAFAAENPAAVERLVLYAPVWLRQGPPRDVEREITSFAIDRVPPSVHAAPVGRIGSH